MKKNLGTSDRIVRLIIAVLLAGLVVAKVITGVVGIILFVLAIILVLTIMTSRCPIYAIFGLNTCHSDKSAKHA